MWRALPAVRTRRPTLELGGWLAFLVGSALFLGRSLADGDLVTITGSALFVLGVVLFLAGRR